MKKRVKIAVTGGAGQIGYALLPSIAKGLMFGLDVEVELKLLERSEVVSQLDGVAMELEDCASPLLKKITCTDSLKEAMDGVDWALLVGSVPRKQGMERSDLLKINGEIFIEQGKAINDYASDGVQVLVVGNPCNTNALIAKHHAKDIPANRFYAMTMLDELRARAQLSKKAGVEIEAVTEMTIWGNHSSTQYPDFYHAKINGVSAAAVINDESWLKDTFVPVIQQRGAAVLKARGASSAASAANAIVQQVYHIVHDTRASDSFSVALSSEGQYGVDPGLMFSFPCRVTSGVLRVIEDIRFNAYSQEKFNATLAELRAERDAVRALGLLGNS